MADTIDVRLRYRSKEHNRVVDALRSRIRYGQEKLSNYYKQMAEAEDRFTAYVPESEADSARRAAREDEGKMSYRTIEIPLSYATLMAAHTYISTVFLSRNPVFQLAGRHGESEQQTQAMEAMMDYQLVVGDMLPALYIWLFDPGKYGFGVVGHYWDREVVRTRKTVMEPRTFLGMPLPGSERPVEKVIEIPGYQGNRVFNIRPQDWISDPRVSLMNFQKGEFCGRYVEIPWHEILEGERSGRFFNVDALKHAVANNGNMESFVDYNRDSGGRSTDLPGDDVMWFGTDDQPPFIKGHEIVVRLSPKDWKLAPETLPELWVFTLAANGILIEATPLGEASTRFPFDLIQGEPEGYNFFTKSLESRLRPLNDVLSWLFNSHMYNVRAALNNSFIIDPSMVVMKDVENPGAGKVIRLKPTAYGRDVRMALTQLAVTDVTRSHVADGQVVMDFLQRVSGVNDAIMGMAGGAGSRRTATEVRTSTGFGINRLKTTCEYMSACGFSPFARKLVQRTQLNYSGQMKLKLVGDLATFSPGFLNVTPDHIAGFWDFIPVDGTLPVDRFAQVNMWNNLMQTMMKAPELMMGFDINKIFAWVANLGGVRNLQQMRVVVRPDDQMALQAQRGNVVPLKGPQPEAPKMPPGGVPAMQTGEMGAL